MSSCETKQNVRRWIVPATRTVVTIGLLALISQLSAQKRPEPVKSVRLYVFDLGTLKIPDPANFGFKKEQLATTDLSVISYLIVHPQGTLLCALDAHDRRDFPQGPARGFAPACAWTWAHRHCCRAPSTFPPGASGMDSLTHGALDPDHRAAHSAPLCTHHERQAAPGDGLPFVSGDHSPGWAVLTSTHGSRRRT